MKINLYEIIKKKIPEYIVERWISYFLGDDVEIMKYDFYSTYSYDDSIKIVASATWTKKYTVLLKIILNQDKNIKLEYACSCPAFEDKWYCKHIPAVVLEFMFQWVLEENEWSLEYWEKEDLDDLIHFYNIVHHVNDNKVNFKHSFLWYIQKRYIWEEEKNFFNKIYWYTKVNIELFFKLPNLAFENTIESKNEEDELYKVKIKPSRYDVYLWLYKSKVWKNGKLSSWKELGRNQKFPKKYDILKPFMTSNSYYDNDRYTLSDSYELFILMCKKFIDKLYFDKYKINSIKDSFKLKLSIEKLAKDMDEVYLKLIISNWNEKYSISDFQNVFYKNNVWFAHKDDKIIFFTWNITDKLFNYILNDYNLVKLENKEVLNKLNPSYFENVDWLENIGYKEEKIDPNFKLIVKPDFENETILFQTEILYNNEKIDVSNKNEIIKIEKNTIYKRNLQKENEFKNNLENIFQKEFSNKIEISIDEKIWDIFEKIEKLKNVEIFYEEKVKKITSNASFSFEIKSGIDFFDLNTKLEIDGQEVNKLGQFLKSLKKSNWKLVKLEDNVVVVLNDKIKKQLEYLEEIWIDEKNADKNIKLSKYNIWTLLINKENLSYDSWFKELKEKLENFEWIKTSKLPKNLNAQLRDYQKVWYNWLNFLNEYNFGWILADDMWLGKTLQTLSILQKVYNNKKNKKPSLIVCPTSLVFNWIQEAKKFTLDLKIDYIKDSNIWFSDISKDTQIIVVSYGLLTNLVEKWELQNKEFLYVILDEAQNIKNYNTKRAKAVYSLKSRYRLALTWTPIENNLLELWSIFNFLMPWFLWNINKFKQKYVNNKWNLQYLTHKIKPFILRRTKSEVLKDLPEKQEKTILLELNPKQKIFYDKLAKAVKADIQKEIETQWFKKSQFKILEYLTKLRLACLNPNLAADNAPNDSAKLDYLTEKLEELLAWNHSVLIFSQFTKFLTQIKDILDKNNIDYFYLDGATNKKKRAEYVEKFQNKEKQVFLISLKAWWTWLNLTQADYVIHLDPWWNPAVENQATDRAHRIWQKRSVIVQKLIWKWTIEEKILLLQEKKKKLIDDLFSWNFGAKLTKEDIEFVLG